MIKRSTYVERVPALVLLDAEPGSSRNFIWGRYNGPFAYLWTGRVGQNHRRIEEWFTNETRGEVLIYSVKEGEITYLSSNEINLEGDISKDNLPVSLISRFPKDMLVRVNNVLFIKCGEVVR